MVNTALTLLPWKSLAMISIGLGASCNDTAAVNLPSPSTSTSTPFTLTRASGVVSPLIEIVAVRTTLSLGRLVIFKKRPAGISPASTGVGVGPGVTVPPGVMTGVGAALGVAVEVAVGVSEGAGMGVGVTGTAVGVGVLGRSTSLAQPIRTNKAPTKRMPMTRQSRLTMYPLQTSRISI